MAPGTTTQERGLSDTPPSTSSLVCDSSVGVTLEPRNGLVHSPSSPIPTLSSHENLKSELSRVHTFEDRWRVTYIKPERLAKTGFYFLQPPDIVKCAFCNLEVGKWEPGDDPEKEHRRWSPYCPFLRGMSVGNITRNGVIQPGNGNPGYDVCGTGMQRMPHSVPERSQNYESLKVWEALGANEHRGPQHKQFCTEELRLKSYEHWPVSIKQRPELLSEAGFFYTGKGDQTICFYCGGGLKDWEDNDDPWVEHAKWFHKCAFLKLKKGPEFVKNIHEKHTTTLSPEDAKNLEPSSSSSTEQPEETCASKEETSKAIPAKKSSEETNQDDTRLCKVCFMKELGVVFLPCGHIATCVDCASSVSECVICRQKISATLRAFLP